MPWLRLLFGMLIGCLFSLSLAHAQSQLINGDRVIVGTLNYCEDSVGSDAYACNLSPPIITYVTGARYTFKAGTINTGQATLALNGLAAKTIKKWVGTAKADLATGDIQAGQEVDVLYDGTDMQMLSARQNPRGLVFEIGDPAGSALTAAATTTAYVTVPFACTISAYNLLIDAGTITVKWWKIATGTAIPTSGNSINTSGVGISSGTALHSTTLSDFTTIVVAKDDMLALNVTAVATAKYVSATLQCDF
jgi:hypothetical protein